MWTLNNIMADGAEAAEELLRAGFIEVLAHLLELGSMPMSIITNVCWGVLNVSKYRLDLPRLLQLKELLPSINRLLLSVQEEEVVTDLLVAMSNFCEHHLADVVETVNLEKVMCYAKSTSDQITLAAIRVIGSLCLGDEAQVDRVIANGGLEHLQRVLLSPEANLATLREACWALSNIAVGPIRHIQLLIDRGIAKQLIGLLQSHPDACVSIYRA